MALMTRNDQKEPRGRRWVEDDESGQPGDPSGKGRRAGKPDKTDKTKAGKAGRGRLGKGKADQADGQEAKAEPLVPTLPSTNLLPPAVSQRAHAERLQRRFAVAAAVAVAAVGATYLLQAGSISGANDDLAAEQARTAQLSGQANALAPVKTFYATLEANRTTIQATMSREVLMSDVLARLFVTAPVGVSLETVELTVDSAPIAAGTPGTTGAAPGAADASLSECPSPDPYAAPEERAGCLTISGTAVSRASLGEWEARLARTTLFTGLFISDTQSEATTDGAVTTDGAAAPTEGGEGAAEGGAIGFTATVSVTGEAFSNRYADPEFLEGTPR